MDVQSVKIQRSIILIKVFMALVVITLTVQFYKTNIIDFGSIAGAIGILSMLRGFISSPQLLSMPIKSWLGANIKVSTESYFYFTLALVLIVVSRF